MTKCALLLLFTALPTVADVVFTEWMYSGADGEFIEITNTGSRPVDLAGWSFDDERGEAGHFLLSDLGILAPGQSAVLTEADAEAFRAAWSLSADVPVRGDLGNPEGKNIGRADTLHLFDAEGALVDRLVYGDEVIPGCPRTKNSSAIPSSADVPGTDRCSLWILSSPGDEVDSQVSAGGDIGNPGSFQVPGAGA